MSLNIDTTCIGNSLNTHHAPPRNDTIQSVWFLFAPRVGMLLICLNISLLVSRTRTPDMDMGVGIWIEWVSVYGLSGCRYMD